MGIKAIKAVEPEVEHGILEVDLSVWAGEGAIVKFRQPKAADYFPDATELQKIRMSYAEMAPNLLVNCLIIGKCYIPDVDDPQDAVVAQMYKNDLEAFNRKAAEWTQYYAREITLDDKVNHLMEMGFEAQ